MTLTATETADAVMTPARPLVTRFAPSPTGRLHLGHALSALTAHDLARRHGGCFILRIEDIDTQRCRPEFLAALLDDLAWLGITWDEPVRHQSAHFGDYRVVLDDLSARGLVYPCFCTRGDIAAEIAASASAPHGPPPMGPDGPLYPGTCRRLSTAHRQTRLAAGEPHALRLDMTAAISAAGPLGWVEIRDGRPHRIAATPAIHGDVVLARKDVPASYHLTVSHDDAHQGITHVVRGRDLRAATHLHRLLQALMGWPVPVWQHHRLLTDDRGQRLAKRTPGVRLADLRAAGVTPAEIRRRLGLGPAGTATI